MSSPGVCRCSAAALIPAVLTVAVDQFSSTPEVHPSQPKPVATFAIATGLLDTLDNSVDSVKIHPVKIHQRKAKDAGSIPCGKRRGKYAGGK